MSPTRNQSYLTMYFKWMSKGDIIVAEEWHIKNSSDRKKEIIWHVYFIRGPDGNMFTYRVFPANWRAMTKWLRYYVSAEQLYEMVP